MFRVYTLFIVIFLNKKLQYIPNYITLRITIKLSLLFYLRINKIQLLIYIKKIQELLSLNLFTHKKVEHQHHPTVEQPLSCC